MVAWVLVEYQLCSPVAISTPHLIGSQLRQRKRHSPLDLLKDITKDSPQRLERSVNTLHYPGFVDREKSKMASSEIQASGAHTPLTHDELSQALRIDVYDQEGKTMALGELVAGKRTALVFIRHFCKIQRVNVASRSTDASGCLNCQAYVRCLSEAIPPSKLPPNTQSKSTLTFSKSR